MTGQGEWAQLLRQRFDKACERLGLNREKPALDLSRFAPPAATGRASFSNGRPHQRRSTRPPAERLLRRTPAMCELGVQ
jgi:hypothetical protein